MTFRPDLGTTVIEFTHNFKSRRSTILIPSGACTDMSGAIAIAKAVDPEVQEIWVIAGTNLDCRYTLKADGEWKFTDEQRGKP